MNAIVNAIAYLLMLISNPHPFSSLSSSIVDAEPKYFFLLYSLSYADACNEVAGPISAQARRHVGHSAAVPHQMTACAPPR